MNPKLKRALMVLWDNKQAITGAVTAGVSLAAGAGLMTAEMSVKVTAVTGLVTLALGVAYTLVKAYNAPTVSPGEGE